MACCIMMPSSAGAMPRKAWKLLLETVRKRERSDVATWLGLGLELGLGSGLGLGLGLGAMVIGLG